MLIQALIEVIGGFLLLVWGADRLVAGASATARNLGVSPLIIGLTIVGFGTSAPEMVVSAVAASHGNPSLAVGNAIGSNITNIGLVLGLTAIFYPLRVESLALKREYPILMLVMLITSWLMLDFHLSRIDGVLLLGGLVALMAFMVNIGLKRPESDPLTHEFEAEIPTDMRTSRALMWLTVGLIVLPASSHFLVQGSITIAKFMGVSDAVIGLTLVAFGTSLPELAAAITSAIKREDEIAIGNVIGSNMFNLLGVLGIAATISPLAIDPSILRRDTAVMFVLTLLLLAFAWGINVRSGKINRKEGGLLLAIYVGYMTLLLINEVG